MQRNVERSSASWAGDSQPFHRWMRESPAGLLGGDPRYNSVSRLIGETRAKTLTRTDSTHRKDETTRATVNAGVIVQCSGRDDTATLNAAISAGKDQWVVIANGQTCAAADVTIPNLHIERGGLLRPETAHTIKIGNFSAGNYQVFTNALAGQGTISFTGGNSGTNPLWWATNALPGVTDMTAAVQAAITATRGRGKVFLPQSSYLITDTLTIPTSTQSGPQSFSPIVVEGEGPFLSNLINKARPNRPTLLLNRDLVIVRNLGFWGDDSFPNDGIKISSAGRIYIDGNEFFVKGNAVYLEKAQSIWIQNNYGSVSAGSSLSAGMVTHLTSYGAATSSFVFINIPDAAGFAEHVVIRDNMNEGYNYQVYTANPGANHTGSSWLITGNQFESSANGGVKLDYVSDFDISGNYISEGQANPNAGYAIDLNNCRNGRVGPNHIHVPNGGMDYKSAAVRLIDSASITLMGALNRVYVAGSISAGIVGSGTFIDRIQDETSDHRLSLLNSRISDITVPLATLNAESGRSTWYSDTTSVTTYPTARRGDRIFKITPTSDASPGWVCTTASSTGALGRLTGRGPSPVVLNDYADPTAYEFRITVLSGGVTGKATYKVEWKTPGKGEYADLTNTTTATELAHLIKRERSGGPPVSFSIRWPPNETYVAGDAWSLLSVVAAEWRATP